ncbi:hypothetical protein B0H65DRAFT_227559 [Neurospora tetraspora]|uniref:Vegetative cell wall protein gp1 n=1 Tax=Neurospora tetraspora TaxID=94610 RepID=A0AAE0JCM3_9PEZI|nr:hypothetical protein B0H65DRAFT_227559 [Neurospora tetraspora]
MAAYSPYESTRYRDVYAHYDEDRFASASTTPSPRQPAYFTELPPRPQRPATRAHFRSGSVSGYTNAYSSPRGSFSPRYTSDGHYATANVSHSRSSRKQSFSDPRSNSKSERRSSYSYYRASDSHGESDEDELDRLNRLVEIELDGVIYMVPAQSKSKRYSTRDYFTVNAGGQGTDYHCYAQAGPHRDYYDRESAFPSPRYDSDRTDRRPLAGQRRSSTSHAVPQRPQTARPASSSHKKPPPPTRVATEEDAKNWKIPPGYSLKNWDPTEEPIMLLGSVFDANSLGKWIYDWTVYHHGPATPISEMAGELWLLLIQLAGKIKRADHCMDKVRTKENKEILQEFMEAGDRLTDKLRKLLKACEAPMLRSTAKQRSSSLGKGAGVEFVDTLFGRERELEKTERFMSQVRLWNLRFDANCEDILRNPTA